MLRAATEEELDRAARLGKTFAVELAGEEERQTQDLQGLLAELRDRFGEEL